MPNPPEIVPARGLAEVLVTQELARRPSRPPDLAAENRALVALATTLAENPAHILQRLAEFTRQLCGADSAAVSIAASENTLAPARWQAAAGAWANCVKDGQLRAESPGGLALERDGCLLLRTPERHFEALRSLEPPAVEALVAPFYVGDRPAGTIWAVAHTGHRRFDAEDARVLRTIARFASAAYATMERLGMVQGLQRERLAALNLMEDALAARREVERAAAALRVSEAALRASEERLREADRRKNDFLALLGHELRNPLAAIRGGIILLSSEKAKPATRARALPIVADQVAHVERLIDDLLDVTRIVSGRVQLQRARITVQKVLADAVEMLRLRIESGAFDLQMRVAPEPLEVDGDAVRLTQIVVNVLGNAMKYSGGERRIDLSAQAGAGEACISIRDYGPGIAPELLPCIFEPFMQAKPALTLEGGVGLGLAVVRQLVELHGGRVEALSSAGRQGAEFVIHLPLAADSGENSPRSPRRCG